MNWLYDRLERTRLRIESQVIDSRVKTEALEVIDKCLPVALKGTRPTVINEVHSLIRPFLAKLPTLNTLEAIQTREAILPFYPRKTRPN